jgi:hypothetical protein
MMTLITKYFTARLPRRLPPIIQSSFNFAKFVISLSVARDNLTLPC